MNAVDPLREEHNRLRSEALRKRKDYARTGEGRFAREMTEAMREYDTARAAGVAREDACKGLLQVLRGLLKVTKFPHACDSCDDTGWRLRFCTHDLRCGRKWCVEGHPAQEHAYVEPCVCERGDRMRKRVVEMDDEIAAAGRVAKKKPRTWSRMGS